MNKLTFNENDGGRAAYFTAKGVGDCVTRAVAIATGKDYKQVYDEITRLVGYTPRDGVRHCHTKKVMAHFGGSWHPLMEVGKGCRNHLRAGEIPMHGRIVCNVSKHVCAVIDGVLNDTYDCSREGNRCVYGYWWFGKEVRHD
jgi:hypothetical protein